MFITYAQNREDVILDALFSDVEKGFYVDIGAGHPELDSVTKHFYLKGWKGINVEPIKELYDLLEKERPNDVNVNLGISDRDGELILREYVNTGLSTFSAAVKRDYSKHKQDKTKMYSDVEVHTITLKRLFIEYPVKHIHFMKVDVEGLEYEVLKGNDWKRYRPEVLCIEANRITKEKDWRPLLEECGYTFIYNDGLNSYYVADESKARKHNFSYVETMLVGDQIMPFHVHNRIIELEGELQRKDTQLRLNKIHEEQLNKDKKKLEHEIREQQRLKSTIKLFAKALDRFILAYIEKLRRTRSSEPTITTHVPATYNKTNRELLLDSVFYADIIAYYTTKTLPKPKKAHLYKTVKGSYMVVRKLAALPYRLLKAGKKEIHHE